MSDNFIKKIVNISLILCFVVFSGFSIFKMIDANKDSISINDLNIDIIEEENTEEDLNVPIKDTVNNSNESYNSNLGAKNEDKNKHTYNIEILNLESLSAVIPTNGNELYEVYYNTFNQVSDLLVNDTYAYIDGSTVSYNNYILKFTLFDYANDKKIADITAKIPKPAAVNVPSDIYVVENLSLLSKYSSGNPEYLISVHSTIEAAVKKANPKSKGCTIKTDTISNKDNILSFEVVDLNEKSKPIKITLK